MINKKLQGLWNGDWPYEQHEGVGLFFTGLPNDDELFIRIMAYEGCHPEATARIKERLVKFGSSSSTVMSGLNFRWLKKNLDKLGVNMRVIPPQPNWSPRFVNKKPFPVELIPSNHYPAEDQELAL